MSVVCLDTQVLIWAIKEEAEPGQEEMIWRSKALINRLEKSNKKLLIPSVVVGEFLVRIPTENHQKTINLIDRLFMVAEYDVRAAAFYAKIWRAKQDSAVLEELKNSGKTRQELKADRMIVATALASGAECIYSHDKGVRLFGEGFIDVQEIPDGPIQPNLL